VNVKQGFFGDGQSVFPEYDRGLQKHDGIPSGSVELPQAALNLLGLDNPSMNRLSEAFHQIVQPLGPRLAHGSSRDAGAPRRASLHQCYTRNRSAILPPEPGGARVSIICREDGSWPEGVEERPLAGDASSRRYSRLVAPGGSTAILVRYRQESLKELPRDMAVLDWCEARGLRVPHRYGLSKAAGTCCFEDWGDRDAGAVLAGTDPLGREELAFRLVDPLIILAGLQPEDLPPWNPPLDRDRLRRELEGCERWFLGKLLGLAPDPAVRRWFDELAEHVGRHPLRICHRDYHLNNLFFLPDGSVGVLDIQDVLVGPDTYDAVSLLGDRAFPELFGAGFRREWLGRWARETAALPGWERRAAEAEVQRGFKVLGTFAWLSVERSLDYARWLPSLARRMADSGQALGAPESLLARLLDWAVESERRRSGEAFKGCQGPRGRPGS